MSLDRALRLASAALVLLIAGCTEENSTGGGTNVPRTRPTLPQTYRPSGHMAAGDVFVHLFEWTWPDIATECETVLGPAGYKAVQVSPPSEHSITPSHDWSERYQTVSYSLAKSRSGTQAQFVDMVNRCATAGVGIYVDAVINHMTNFPSPGAGSNGTTYTKYSYPGLYQPTDFHTACALNNYSSAANVQDCELFSLPDLDTGSPTVRQKIADYLIALARLGVAGFRVDAAKHMQQVELDDIFDRLNAVMTAEARPIPYVFLEVSAGSGEALAESDFFGVGYGTGGATDITEFTTTGLADKFRKIDGQKLAELDPNGPAGARFSEAAWGLMPADKGVIFLQNHDTQHNCGISPADGDVYRLAHVFMLAQPYGYPSVMSSYAFNCPAGNSTGPRSDPSGWTLPVSCISDWAAAVDGDWICEHRDPYIRNMVGFRRLVAGANITGWWDNDANAIAFSRGDKGFVAINRETISITQTVATPLAPGAYCDRITGGKVGGACVGTTLTVAGDGTITFTLATNRALAIDTSTKL